MRQRISVSKGGSVLGWLSVENTQTNQARDDKVRDDQERVRDAQLTAIADLGALKPIMARPRAKAVNP